MHQVCQSEARDQHSGPLTQISAEIHFLAISLKSTLVLKKHPSKNGELVITFSNLSMTIENKVSWGIYLQLWGQLLLSAWVGPVNSIIWEKQLYDSDIMCITYFVWKIHLTRYLKNLKKKKELKIDKNEVVNFLHTCPNYKNIQEVLKVRGWDNLETEGTKNSCVVWGLGWREKSTPAWTYVYSRTVSRIREI